MGNIWVRYDPDERMKDTALFKVQVIHMKGLRVTLCGNSGWPHAVPLISRILLLGPLVSTLVRVFVSAGNSEWLSPLLSPEDPVHDSFVPPPLCNILPLRSRAFTPQLAKIYGELTSSGRNFEVVFVSSDRNQVW